MAKFLTELELSCIDDGTWILDAPLKYESDLLKQTVTVPTGFKTDLASVPRFPIAYQFWGGRAHREAVIHDFLYCIDSDPVVSEMTANDVFFEAMECRGKSVLVRYPMWWGVVLFGWLRYHKKRVMGR
jgi:hypothetical protein